MVTTSQFHVIGERHRRCCSTLVTANSTRNGVAGVTLITVEPGALSYYGVNTWRHCWLRAITPLWRRDVSINGHYAHIQGIIRHEPHYYHQNVTPGCYYDIIIARNTGAILLVSSRLVAASVGIGQHALPLLTRHWFCERRYVGHVGTVVNTKMTYTPRRERQRALVITVEMHLQYYVYAGAG